MEPAKPDNQASSEPGKVGTRNIRNRERQPKLSPCSKTDLRGNFVPTSVITGHRLAIYKQSVTQTQFFASQRLQTRNHASAQCDRTEIAVWNQVTQK